MSKSLADVIVESFKKGDGETATERPQLQQYILPAKRKKQIRQAF